MIKFSEFLIFLFISFILLPVAYANSSKTADNSLIKDTVCYMYSFAPGDTLIYDVKSIDSISVDYEPPLIKERYEQIQIVCDSVSDNGVFHLSQTLIEFHSLEADLRKEKETAKRDDHPWIGKTAHISIDSFGNRVSVLPIDNGTILQSPGSGFQPYLLFPFNESCKSVGESWLVETIDELVENSNPPSLLRSSSLFRARKPNDTLGYNCNVFEYVKTGQGTIETVNNGNQIKVSSVINSFGVFHISDDLNIPVHYFVTIEQKLKLHLKNNAEMPILHFITSNFTLKDIKTERIKLIE